LPAYTTGTQAVTSSPFWSYGSPIATAMPINIELAVDVNILAKYVENKRAAFILTMDKSRLS